MFFSKKDMQDATLYVLKQLAIASLEIMGFQLLAVAEELRCLGVLYNQTLRTLTFKEPLLKVFVSLSVDPSMHSPVLFVM